GVYVSVHVLTAVATAVSVQAAGTNVPLPPRTEKLTVPVGCATGTATPFVSTPVSVTVTVHRLEVWPTVRVGSGQFKLVVVTCPVVTVVVPVSVSRLK